ncbi:MAG: tRNA pseudouridine(55) synthase TruB [Magnetococcales bacterium]|nr:tRNA pseudouridine(55) synthase TruB [Magnetococcales bacterium]
MRGRGRKAKGKPLHGWLAIHKEAGLTSTRVVELVRKITQAAKAGHGGTLDPFSEGLLPIGLGDATKTIAMVLEGDKAYRCWVHFGKETDSGDLTGKVTRETGEVPIQSDLEEALTHFQGTITQIPPHFSAIRVDGVRAYKLARQGKSVEMAPREVTLHEVTLENFTNGVAELKVRCGKGTYMRALARDLGSHLGCGAHLERLVRTDTLGFKLEDAVTLDGLREKVSQDLLQDVLFPVDRVLDDIPALRLQSEAWQKVRQGQPVWVEAENLGSGRVRLLTPEGRFGAIGDLGRDADILGRRNCRPKKLFLAAAGQ